MNHIVPALVATLVAGMAGTLSPGAASPRGAGPGDEILRLEDEFAAGLVRRDEAVLRRLLADGFVYSENDRTMSRDTLIEELIGGTERVEAARNEDLEVHSFGETAVVTGWLVVRGKGAGGPFDRRYRFTDTWQRRRGRWQLIGAHDYLVP